VARTRTTKKLAQRIDLNYFKRPTPLKRAKFWLSLLLPLLALVWITGRALSKDSRVYSSGRMSQSHAVLEKECAACHVQQASAFPAKAADAACLSCHDGPIHHEVSTVSKKSVACAECHTEHRGRVNTAAVANQFCAVCHADLGTAYEPSKYERHILSLEDGHPEFEALRAGSLHSLIIPSTIKLNHAVHMKLIRRGPNGPIVQLECADCHRPVAVSPPTTYSDSKYVGTTTSYAQNIGSVHGLANALSPRHPASGREFMAPVKFANACSGCHLLTFDKRFDEGVPHDKPEVVRAFMLEKFRDYIAARPEALRERRDPDRELTGKSLAPEFQMLTPAQWVAEHTGDAEELLWRKTCIQCHQLTHQSLRLEGTKTLPPIPWLRTSTDSRFELKTLPEISPMPTIVRWMPHAKFDHDAHRGFTCVSCHAKALRSTESSNLLLPGIETCKTCHAPGPDHAESRCFECHTYHDWSRRKEVTPRFTLPALRTGGR
jgi:hypothetical protein